MLKEKGPLLQEEKLLILYFVAVLLFFCVFAVVIVITYQRRKNKLLSERYEAEQRFTQTIASSKLEIQEQTLKNIAWELHDNVGQLLSVASMQLNRTLSKIPADFHQPIIDTKNIVSEVVQEIRSLSKILNNDVILKNGLVDSLQIELDRFNRLNYLEATLLVEGEHQYLAPEKEIILFRILQEFFNNVMKHAKATTLNVTLTYSEDFLLLNASDDGEGFDTSLKTASSGMETMSSRAALLKANYALISAPNKGTSITINCPLIDDTK